MSIFVIGDLHLSTACDKKMDVFGGWENYQEQIKENWLNTITDEDVCIIPGDFSWGMSLQEALSDFKLLESLPGRKILLKGNHDYWWESLTKMKKFLEENGIKTIEFLHNNSIVFKGIGICGTRGWMIEEGSANDKKITSREEGRLRLSLESCKDESCEKVVFLHYPPVYNNKESGKMLDIMKEYGVKRCYYGHIHGRNIKGLSQSFKNVELFLISADFLKFKPKILKIN